MPTIEVDMFPLGEKGESDKPGLRRSDVFSVLLVDDESLVRAAGVDILSEAGFEVFEAINADEALLFLEGPLRIDVLLTDVDMPGSRDGLELAHIVAEHWPDLAIIVSSGFPLLPEMLPERCCFIAKPYDEKTVVQIIHRHAKRARTKKKLV
jgi:DNA-binding NtrC family response regulator